MVFIWMNGTIQFIFDGTALDAGHNKYAPTGKTR